MSRDTGRPDDVLRRDLAVAEAWLRSWALLGLSAWAAVEHPSTDLFQALSGLTRPSFGTWNGLLAALRKVRRDALRAARADLRGEIEAATPLTQALDHIARRLAPAEIEALAPLAELVRRRERPRTVGDAVEASIALRNRVAHDPPADANDPWWAEAANALSPLGVLLAAHAPGPDRAGWPAPWFLSAQAPTSSPEPLAFNGLEDDFAARFVGAAGARAVSPERGVEVLHAVARLLGRKVAQEGDLRRTLGRLAPDDASGVLLGDLLLTAEVGAGGWATVYRGTQLTTGRRVAVKVLHDGATETARARFRQEAELLSRVTHPHVVAVLDQGEDPWRLPRTHSVRAPWIEAWTKGAAVRSYLVLEWIDGPTLEARYQAWHGATPTEPRADDRTLLGWMRDAARAIEAVHTAGLIHRDVKPGNLMLGGDGRIKLLDLGIARSQDEGRTLVTTHGSALGTPAYMAPEQLAARDAEAAVGPRADVYGLAATFYELWTGRRLFDHVRDAARATTRKLEGVLPDRPRALVRGLAREVESLLLGGLEPGPADRYPSATALAEDCEHALRDEPLRFRPPGPLRRLSLAYRRSRTVASMSILFAVLSLGGTGKYLDDMTRERTRTQDQRDNAQVQAERARNEALRANLEAARANDEARKATTSAERATQESLRASAEATRANRAAELAREETRAKEEARRQTAAERDAKDAALLRAEREREEAVVATAHTRVALLEAHVERGWALRMELLQGSTRTVDQYDEVVAESARLCSAVASTSALVSSLPATRTEEARSLSRTIAGLETSARALTIRALDDLAGLCSGRAFPITSIGWIGTQLVVGARSGHVARFDVKGGSPLQLFQGHVSSVFAIVEGPDSSFLSSDGGDVCLWGPDGRPRWHRRLHGVRAIAYDSTRREVVVAIRDGTLARLRAEGGATCGEWSLASDDEATAPAPFLSTFDSEVFAIGPLLQARSYGASAASGSRSLDLGAGEGGDGSRRPVAAAGRWAVTADATGRVSLLDLTRERPPRVVESGWPRVEVVACARDGTLAASLGTMVRIWQPAARTPSNWDEGGEQPVVAAALSSDGSMVGLILSGGDLVIRRGDGRLLGRLHGAAETPRSRLEPGSVELPAFEGGIRALKEQPSGALVVLTDAAVLLRGAAGRMTGPTRVEGRPLAVSPDGRHVAGVHAERQELFVSDLSTGKVVARVSTGDSWVGDCVAIFASDAFWVSSGLGLCRLGLDGSTSWLTRSPVHHMAVRQAAVVYCLGARLWTLDPVTRTSAVLIDLPVKVDGPSIHRPGSWGTAMLGMEPSMDLPELHIRWFVPSPDGKEVLGVGSRELTVFSTETGKIVGRHVGHSESDTRAAVTGAVYTPDSTSVVTTGSDGGLLILDRATGRLSDDLGYRGPRFMGRRPDTYSLPVVSADGRTLYAVRNGQELRFWPLLELKAFAAWMTGEGDEERRVMACRSRILALGRPLDLTLPECPRLVGN